MRILSLLPAGTEIVHALGLTEHLVGVSVDSNWPPEVASLPRVSQRLRDTPGLSSGEIDAAVEELGARHQGRSLHHVDPELVRELRPDLILTQELCDVCALGRGEVERALAPLGSGPAMLSL